MINRLPLALLFTWLWTFLTGYLCLLLLLLLFNDELYELFFMAMIGLGSNLLLSFLFPLLFCLPVALIDRKKLEQLEKLQAVKRYLPIVTFMPALFFLFIIGVGGAFGIFGAEFFIFIINTFLIGYAGLWFFIRSINLPDWPENISNEKKR